METLIVLWDFPLCKKLESKLIFFVYSVILGQCFAFYLKQITKKESDRSIEKITKKQFICIFLILVLFLSFSSLIWLLDRVFFKGSLVTLDFEYTDDCLLGTDVPVFDLDVLILLDGATIGEVTTNVDGQAFIRMIEDGVYSYKYHWKGEWIEVFDPSGYMEEVLDCTTINPTFIWADDLSLAENMEFDLMYFDGSNWITLTTITTDNYGQMDYALDGLFMGEFMFENQNDTFTVVYTTLDLFISEVYIMPILKKIKEIKAVLCLGREKQSFS